MQTVKYTAGDNLGPDDAAGTKAQRKRREGSDVDDDFVSDESSESDDVDVSDNLNSLRAQGKKFRNKVSTPRNSNKTPIKKSINNVQSTPTRQSPRKTQTPRKAATPRGKALTPRKQPATPSAKGRAKTTPQREDRAAAPGNTPKAKANRLTNATIPETHLSPLAEVAASPTPEQALKQDLSAANNEEAPSSPSLLPLVPQPATQQLQGSRLASDPASLD